MGGRYQIVTGSAAGGLPAWPVYRAAAVVRQLTDNQCMQLALVENPQRDDLNPVEEARGYQNLWRSTI